VFFLACAFGSLQHYLFLHSVTDVWHILLNMLMLWMFGRECRTRLGRSRFLRIIFFTGVGAGLINVIVNNFPHLLGAMIIHTYPLSSVRRIFGVFDRLRGSLPTASLSVPHPVALKMK